MGPTCLLPSPGPSDVGLKRASPDCQVGGSSLMPGQEVRSAGSGETLEDLETSPISQAGGQPQTAWS